MYYSTSTFHTSYLRTYAYGPTDIRLRANGHTPTGHGHICFKDEKNEYILAYNTNLQI